jgi:hypothetical protein
MSDFYYKILYGEASPSTNKERGNLIIQWLVGWLVGWLMSFTLTPRKKRYAGYNYFLNTR